MATATTISGNRMSDSQITKRITIEDPISSLPDPVIGHIFSFLSIKDILKTSVLSKQWRFMWTKTSTVSYTCPLDLLSRFNFTGFSSLLDRVFVLCDSPSIQKFQLEMLPYDLTKKDKFDLWLMLAVGRCVEDVSIELHTSFDDDGLNYVLPEFLFAYQSVVSLRVSHCSFTLGGGCCTINWSSLKILRVGGVEMTDNTINEVLKGSPALEHLGFNRCWGMKHIQVYSRKMRELVIDSYGDRRFSSSQNGDEGEGDDFMLEISAPHLLSLKMLGVWHRKRVVILHEVSSLVEVNLDFFVLASRQWGDVVYEMLKGLLRKLCCVNRLVIGNWILMVLRMVKVQKGPSLRFKCRRLILHAVADEWELLGIAELLECARNVERLVINLDGHFSPPRHDLYVHIYEENFRRSLMKTLKCLAEHLKTIEINEFQAVPAHQVKCQLSLIAFLLREALVLEKMVINAEMPQTSGDRKVSITGIRLLEVLVVRQEILSYERGSKNSEVVFNYPSLRKPLYPSAK